MRKQVLFCLLFAWLVLGFSPQALAQETVADSLISLELSDGSILRGTIVSEDADTVTFITSAGIKITMPKSTIATRSVTRGRMVEGRFHRFDPNYTRLLFAPTGRPLRKGEGYFTDYYVFFPGVAYGLTDHISIMAGISVLPGVGLGEQMLFVAPRYGTEISEMFALSGGFLYMNFGGEFSTGLAFATGTYGTQEKCFTAGIGLGYTYNENDAGNKEFEFAKHPIFVWGGNIRLSNSISFVSENWIITGENFDMGFQPFSIALRFFGEHIAVDAGAIIMLEILEEGFPIPWLSFVYNFGG
ncbi:hypothetical protein KKC74_05810 [bacterium]|nr:hypothetical protein [bacterium]MBU1064307.1 hypothetical protein [bacterium]MBU1875446.1 hypothetical protein [bacterium]